MLTELEAALEVGDEQAIRYAVLALGDRREKSGQVPDEVAFAVLDLLRRDEMKTSPFAGHVLNFFEFEARQLSPRVKDRCRAFLDAWGGHFKHPHSVHVIGELRFDDYLK